MALCGETVTDRVSYTSRSRDLSRFSAQVRVRSPIQPFRAAFVALCGETVTDRVSYTSRSGDRPAPKSRCRRSARIWCSARMFGGQSASGDQPLRYVADLVWVSRAARRSLLNAVMEST